MHYQVLLIINQTFINMQRAGNPVCDPGGSVPADR
jgi:hypothetical protein